MSDWEFAQAEPEQQLAKMHHFSMVKRQEGGEVEFTITVKEFLTPKDPAMGFFAQADKQTTRAWLPTRRLAGGKTLLAGLAQCMREVERFPYRP